MGRRTVRAEISTKKPDEFMKLVATMIAAHDAAPDQSDLSPEEVAELRELYTQTRDLRDRSAALHAEAEALSQKAQTLMGAAKGQSINTRGTLYFLVSGIRAKLLLKYRGLEEQLSKYGFNVVIGMSKTPTKKPPTDVA
jgi:nitroreductase